MAFYTNQTRHNAVVTLHVQTTNDPEKSIEKGAKDASFATIAAGVGYHDILVEPGLELSLGANTTATLVGVRGDN